MHTSLQTGALDGRRFVVEVFSELDEQTIGTRWQAVNAILRLSMLTGLQMQIEPTLNLLCDYCSEMIDYEFALVYFWSDADDRFVLRAMRGLAAPKEKSPETSNIFNFWAAKYSQPLVVRAGENESADAFLSAVPAHSALIVPLFVSNRVMGSLQFFSSKVAGFSQSDAQLLWILSLVAENLLTKENTNEGLLRFAFTDYLTGLRSRGYFEQQLELEMKRASRKQETFALMMVDIDHFKTFNDNYGHHFGDQVLRDVSSILMSDMREVDTLARYGGEEFVIVLPETGKRGALQVADRLRHSIEQTKFFAGEPAQQQQLTISIGTAFYPEDGGHRTELIEAADAALYAAKAAGRNRVVSYSALLNKHHPE